MNKEKMKTVIRVVIIFWLFSTLVACNSLLSITQTPTPTPSTATITPTKQPTKIWIRFPTVTPHITLTPFSNEIQNDIFVVNHLGSKLEQYKFLNSDEISLFDTQITSTCAYTGQYGILLSYSIKSNNYGYGEWGVSAETFPLIDVSELRALEFRVRGISGGETFNISIDTESGGEPRLNSKNYVEVSSSEWKLVRVPFSDFYKNFNPKVIWGFSFIFFSFNGAGSICIDNIALVP